MTRRELVALSAAFATPAQSLDPIVERHDKYVSDLLKKQITDPNHRWRGTYADEYGLHFPVFAGGIINACTAAYLHPKSKHHKSRELVGRIRLAADLLSREQSPDGNIDLPITNFNSPPDTGFLVRNLCPAAVLAKRAGETEILRVLDPVLKKCGSGLVKGGIHTPNHRWVVSAALAELYDLYGNPEYLKRIDQWLAEGIDIDSDGQFSERSTYVYNPITDSAFVTMAAKLKRPELLEPVRRNLESMMYLIHPGYEVVTEISTRQDLNQRGDMGAYWFSLAYMARVDKDGRFATLAEHFAPTRASLSAIMEYPELAQPLPRLAPVPDNYERAYPHNHFVRVRRGNMSAAIFGGGRTRPFTFRNGEAVINAVRFASAFFGKGQFKGAQVEKKNGSWVLTQTLEGPYYQPLQPARKVNADEWAEVRRERKQTEIARLTQTATFTEKPKGFRVRIQSHGTKDVPLAVEINFREGGKLEGVKPAHNVTDGWVLPDGHGVFRAGSDAIRFGPGAGAHMYTQVRGAEPKLSGPSVYITGFTPFDKTIEFDCL